MSAAKPARAAVAPQELPALAHAVAGLPGPQPARPDGHTRTGLDRKPSSAGRCAQLRELAEQLRAEGLALDTLSMGMSADLAAAIAEGATMVRIGTAIFGERHYARMT